MTFPTVDATATPYGSSADALNHTVDLPNTINSGDLLLLLGCFDGSAGTTTITGWTKIINDVGMGTDAKYVVAYRIADGTEGASVTVTISATEALAAMALRVTGWHGTTPPEAATSATGTSVNPNSGSLSPSWGSADNLWLSLVGIGTGVLETVSVWALADDHIVKNSSGTANTGAQVILSTAKSAVATLDPGAYTVNTSDNWAATTVAVRPAAAAVDRRGPAPVALTDRSVMRAVM